MAAPGRRAGLCFLAAALLLCCYLLPFSGTRGLWEPDEGRYTAVALQMVRTGEWATPFLNHEHPHFTKPPTTYWALAASYKAFGMTEFAARLPNALAMAGTVFLLVVLGWQLLPERPELPAIVYATMLLPVIAANVVTTDTLLTFVTTLAVTAGIIAFQADSRRRHHAWIAVMWAAFGLAFLTKGPAGLLALLPLAAYRWTRGGFGATLRFLLHPAVLLFCAVGFSWYAFEIHRYPSVLGYFVREEWANRVLAGIHHRNPQWYGAVTIYLPTLLFGTLPWFLPVMRAVRALPGMFSRRFLPGLREKRPAFVLGFLWLAMPLVVFLTARSRLPFYVLPLFPAIALLISSELAARQFAWSRLKVVALAGWCVLMVAGRAALGHVPYENDARALAAAVMTQVHSRFDQIAFVNARPYFGLSFYLGREVEDLWFDPQPAPGGPWTPEILREEIVEGGGERQLWILPSDLRLRFKQEVEASGYTAVPTGEWRRLSFFLIRRDHSGNATR